jgi:hypothetical protein
MNTKLITTLEGIRYAFSVIANSSPELAELANHHLRATQEAIDELEGNVAQAVPMQPYQYEA